MPQTTTPLNQDTQNYKLTDNLGLRAMNDSLQLRLNILEKNASDDVAVKYINAIGSSWPFLLVVLLSVIFVWYRKSFFSYLGTANSLKGNIGPAAIELTRQISVSTTISELDAETSNTDEAVDADQVNEQENDEVEAKLQNMFDVYELLDSRKLDEAVNVFNEIQDKTLEEKQRDKNFITFQFYKHLFGYGDGLKELRELAQKAEQVEISVTASLYAARCLAFSNNFPQAIVFFNDALEKSKENGSSELCLEILIAMWSSYRKAGRKQEYVEILLKEVNETTEDDIKVKLYKQIAEVFNDDKEVFESIALLVKANELVSNDTGVLFDIAYRSGNLNYNEIAMQTYVLSNHIKSGQDMVINNLGVTYRDLGVKSKEVEFYKKSFELGNTLAASNLATSYINGGFLKEAQEILDKAKVSEGKIHANVWKSFDSLNNLQKEEEQLIENANKVALQTKEFLVHYSNAILANEKSYFNISVFSPEEGYFIEEQSENRLKFDLGNSFLTINFKSAVKNYGSCSAKDYYKPDKSYKSEDYNGYFVYFNGMLRIVLKNIYIHKKEMLFYSLKGIVLPELE